MYVCMYRGSTAALSRGAPLGGPADLRPRAGRAPCTAARAVRFFTACDFVLFFWAVRVFGRWVCNAPGGG